MATKLQNQWFPVLSLLIGAVMWGVVWYPMRLLEDNGVSGLWLTLGIYIPPALLMSGYLYRHRQWLSKHPWQLAAIGVTAWWTNTAFILAILEGKVMRVLLLFYLSPVWTVLLGRWILKERLTRSSILVLIVAITGGTLMLLRVDQVTDNPITVSDWLALSSGVAFAFHNVFVRMSRSVPITLKSESAWLGVVLGSICAIVVTASPIPSITGVTLLGVIALGVFGMLAMTLLVQYGVTHMTVQRSAVILLFELVAGAISQQLLTNEQMMPQEWVGGLLIIAAAFLASRLPAD